jgi:hypothetical protein
LHRYIHAFPLVADKLLSIAALLSIYSLPTGVNPVRHIYVCLQSQSYIAWDDVNHDEMHFELLASEDLVLLLNFATGLLEQLSKVTLSKQEEYDYV